MVHQSLYEVSRFDKFVESRAQAFGLSGLGRPFAPAGAISCVMARLQRNSDEGITC